MNTRAALEFASWLRVNHPKLFFQAAERADIAVEIRNERAAGRGLGQIVGPPAPETTAKTSWVDTFMKVVGGLGATYFSLDAQKKQLEINIQRAQIGLPPIDVAGNPVLTTEVVLDARTVDKITKSAGVQINKILLWGGAAAAAFFLLR